MKIPLTQGKEAVIDRADWPLVQGYKWTARRDRKRPHVWYALTTFKRKTILLHRLIMQAPNGLQVDHKDGDGLNNRRFNLRLATQKQNSANSGARRNNKTSSFRGVKYNKSRKKWEASIRIDGKDNYLGLYVTAEDAAHAYDIKSFETHGNFARLNIPERLNEPVKRLKAVAPSSRFRGVAWHALARKWVASIAIRSPRKTIYIGLYPTEQEAAMAYDRKAVELHGTNARLNF